MGALNFDTGATGTSGGDLLWNGSTLTPEGRATAAIIIGFGGDADYAALDAGMLQSFSGYFSTRPFPVSTPGSIVGVRTNRGNYAKALVTGLNGGSLSLQFTTYSPGTGAFDLFRGECRDQSSAGAPELGDRPGIAVRG